MRLPQISVVCLLSIVGGEGFFSPSASRQVCASRRSAPINAQQVPSAATYKYQRWDSSAGGSLGLLRGGWGRSWKTRRHQPSSLGLKKAATNDEDAGLGNKASLTPFSRPIAIQGIELTWDVVAILVVYFVQGALGLARLATTFFFKDELHLAPAEVAALSGLFTLPWVFKPLYGFLSDGLPVFGYRRRSYMVLAGLLGASGWFYLANFAETPFQATAGSIVASLGVAVSDVVADSIVVEKARDSDSQAVAGGLQSLCWGSAAVGGITSAYFSGSLLETMTTREVFSLTTYLPLLITVCAIFIDEKRLTENMSSPKQIISEQASALWSAIKNKSVWLPALFIFLWRATPSSDSAYFFFLTNDIGVGPEFLGRVRLGSSIASLVGVWIFQSFLKETKISKVLFWTAVAAVPLGFTQLLLVYHINRDLGIPDELFTFGDDVVLTVLGQIAFMPTLVLSARLCPPGVEGTLFALLMSIFNGGAIVGSEVGAYLTRVMGVTDVDFRNLGMLIAICNVSSLLPLPFLKWIDSVEDDEKAADETATTLGKRK